MDECKDFAKLVEQAKQGKPLALNKCLQQLYTKGKNSLLSLTKSEADAEEYFSVAVAKFWQKFIVGDQELPNTNISGYIYTMAKFLCLDQKRKNTKLQIVSDGDMSVTNRKEYGEEIKTSFELEEEEALSSKKREAMKRGIAKLSKRCQHLFNTIMETGVEKSSQLFEKLGLENARAVTVLRYDCTKQLKIKAAIELEQLLK